MEQEAEVQDHLDNPVDLELPEAALGQPDQPEREMDNVIALVLNVLSERWLKFRPR